MEWLNFGKEKIHKAAINTVSTLKGPPTSSKFLEEGVLTPEEFQKAGDALVFKCPTWKWETGNATRGVDYLPKEKQFLVTRNVPCLMRVYSLEKQVKDSETQAINVEGDDGWFQTHVGFEAGDEEAGEIEIPSEEKKKKEEKKDNSDSDSDDDDIPDIETFNDDNLLVEEEDDDPSTVSHDNLVKTRSYDLSITYDPYYHTPKVWLFGYDENRQPLKPKEVFTDISSDHAKKTVTIDTHPHLGIPCAYIHPCKHANVMKKIVSRQLDAGKQPRVDQYLFFFLKFLSAVLPTMEYDNTIEIEG